MDSSWVVLLISNHLRGPIIRSVAAQTGRQIRVDGKFEAQLFCLHPRITAERVTIGNPPWTEPGVTAEVGRLVLTYNLPWFGQSFGLRRLEAEQAILNLTRDRAGHANWQMHDPDSGDGTGPPLIHSLSMPSARVHFEDEIRRLRFDGTVSAQDAPTSLGIDGAGQLNGREAHFGLSCDTLATVARDRPFRCEFTESSSDSRLTGKVTVPHPFDIRLFDATFAAEGADMKDLYYLAGVSLPDTGTYHLSGKSVRRGNHLEFQDLQANSGRSDVRGALLIELNRSGPSHVEADLQSQLLRVADLGRRAAGRAPAPVEGQPQRVIPDTPIQLEGARKSDAVIHFHAQTFEAGHLAVKSVAAKVTVGDGIVAGAPVSGSLRDGKITGEFRIDASHDVPAVEVDMRVANLKLGQLDAAKGESAPPVDGPLRARLILKGRGRSIREVAANADGTVTAVLPHGALRSSLAELAGLDLRGLGLMAAGNQEDTGIRCGVASFEAKKGSLTAQRLLLDTDPVLITGEGTIDLQSESLDLRFRGQPKRPRLRVRAPLLVRGTFGHPSFSIEAGKPAVQAGVAIALGTLLTPVAAMLAFVDPGLAKDTDCAALLAQVRGGNK